MKKIYDAPVAVVTSFDSKDATNLTVSDVTGFNKIAKNTNNCVNF